MVIKGICSSEFQEIKKKFQNFFDTGKESGANFSVVQNNKVLINIFGGMKNPKDKWNENTMVNTFSLSKGIYASCIAKLINQKELDIEKKVSYYWPKFKFEKENITVKDILSHRSGVYRFKTKISNLDLLDFEKIITILEKQTPDHKPGEKAFYHAKTHGYLVEKLIRNITKMNLKNFFDENFNNKFNLNFHFGVDKKNLNNVAELINNEDYKKLISSEFDAFNNPEHEISFYNSEKWRSTGVASMGGHGVGLSVAKIYDLLANDLKNNYNKIIEQNKLKKILVQSNFSNDESLKLPIKWTYSGYILRGGWIFGPNKEAFGHNGWGGSLGFADPIEGLGVSYVTRKIEQVADNDKRAITLIKKFYEIYKNCK